MAEETGVRTGPAEPGTDGTDPQEAPDPRRWVALIVILVAGFMDLLDATIVNVAVPSIQRDLGAEYAQIEWIVAGYVLAFAALLITGGRLGDIFGRKKLFLLGMGGFTIASALCGLADSATLLIVARFLQGGMAALMVPQILAIIHVTFPKEERGKVFGLFGAVIGSASVAGPVLGGVLVDWNLFDLQWRPIFLINVPVGIAAMIVAWFVVRESKSPTAPKLDLIGMVLAVSGILLLVYPLTEGRSLGWPAWTFVLMGCSAVVLVAFVLYERWRTRTIGSPLVVLKLFRARSFASGMSVWLLFMIALGGFFLVWTLYMQSGLGWTPLHAGLTAVTFALGAAPAAAVSVEVLTPRFGRRVLMAGALLTGGGFAGFGWVAASAGPSITTWQMVAPLVVAGIGFGLVVAPMIDLILTDVPVEDAGSASGLLNTTQQLGMALGVALVGLVFFAQLDHFSGEGVDTVTPELRQELTVAGIPGPAQDQVVTGFRACVQDRSAATDPTEIPPSCQFGTAAPGPQGDRLQQLLTEAGLEANAHNFARTFSLTMWYSAGMLALVFLGMFGLSRTARARDLDAELSVRDGEPLPEHAPEPTR
ncbi:MFS transporter [Amycolatopsis nigrescens]|uniref:MFS transporter n=1 Tax=Amycolatopsis nigrescens TaxID=381445 RepID=UPI00037DB911|nr:DHA2 family efflux MFS transporter permease subunit [Amycolatopsis nigrescens]